MAKRIIKNYEHVSIDPQTLDGPVDFAHIFGRGGPIHIEIGSGKGTFLLSQGRAQPEVNFLGIEYANKYYRYAVDRIGRWSIENVRIIRTEAADFLTKHIADNSVNWFHIYFPDPWPKKRHHKRRFICKANMEQMLRALAENGVINIATDHSDYFDWIKAVVADVSDKAEKIDFTPTAGADGPEAAGTNFERKYISQGRPIYTIAVRKKP